jgi:hypothetical protein
VQTLPEITEKRNDVFVTLSIVEDAGRQEGCFSNNALNFGRMGIFRDRFPNTSELKCLESFSDEISAGKNVKRGTACKMCI